MAVGFSMGARTALHLAAIDPRVYAVVAMGLGEHTLQHRPGATGAVPDALLTEDPESIEQETLRHYREMADAIHADRQALASLMAAQRTELPQLVDEIKVPVLVVTGSDDAGAGDPAPLAAALADATAVLTAGDHAGVKDQPDAHKAIVEFLGSR
jgi:pimeloyl-ACP methyl ester carboxylesterase